MKKSFNFAAIAISLAAGFSVVSIPLVYASKDSPVAYYDAEMTQPVEHIHSEYEVNENGQTYGIGDANYVEDLPDLQLAEGDNGIIGYVYTEDLLHKGAPKNPEEAVAQMEAMKNGTYVPIVMNVYEANGVTVIDTFTVGRSSR
ncbi:MAG: hypothetical protein K2J40_03565 [Ruminococcus sp.]|nr:hypothetical protein [Ruminococcus sp.]